MESRCRPGILGVIQGRQDLKRVRQNQIINPVEADGLSSSPAKPSRPSRVYLHLTKPEHINQLSDKVRSTSFIDVKGSTKDACLLGPPSVEFAPFGRVPNGRPRKDARQGTIDQDPEFIDFLESLTNPVVKPTSVDQEGDSSKGKDKITTTPLVQFLKDKKANKGKDAAAPKNSKLARHEKGEKAAEIKTAVQTVPSSKKRSAQAAKVEQAARDAVKVLNKQAANTKGTTTTATAPKPQSASPKVAPNSAANAALAGKQRERGNVSAAAKILQRDLGIGGNTRGKGARHGASNSLGRSSTSNNQSADKLAAVSTSSQASQTSQTEAAIAPANVKSPAAQPPTGPAADRAPPKTPANSVSQQAATTKSSANASTATQAFLKHANPSQGVTEPLLEEAFKEFGTVEKVEIDKKKGFAYVDFGEPESLQKAIKASPIKVAQGQVQVLERKTGTTLQARNNVRKPGPPMVNNNIRGGAAAMGHNSNGRGGSATGHHNARGGPPMSHRGGMVAGGRGGHLRGRGGANVRHSNKGQAEGAAASVNSSAPAATTSQPTTNSPNPVPAAPAAPTEPAGS